MDKQQTVDAMIGTIVEAVVEASTKDHVIVSIQGRHATVRADEFGELPQTGEKLELYVEGEAKNGLVVCSKLKVDVIKTMHAVESAYKEQISVPVYVVGCDEKGLICDVLSMMGYMPRQQIDVSNIHLPLEHFIGQTLVSKITKVLNDETLIVSHRAAIEKEVLAEREKIVQKLAVGNTYDATVTQIVSYGVFADIGAGVEGLIHKSNLSWSNADPAEVVAIGDKLKVTVIRLDDGKIALDHKQHIVDDWESAAAKYEIGHNYDGKITSLTNFGAFVSLGGKIEGLIHNSELSWDNTIKNASQLFKLNDTVRVNILSRDDERRRLNLSVKRSEENPWHWVAEQYPPGKRVTLPILNIADFGIFVDLGKNLHGLIHQNDISWSNDEKWKTQYKVGELLDCVVLSIDSDQGRASLGMKQLSQDPWEALAASKPIGKSFDATIKRIAKFGAFAALPSGVEGLIHISELAPRRVKSVSDVVSIGDNVRVTVVTFDQHKRRLGLSMTALPFVPDVDVDDGENDKALQSVHEKSNATFADILPDALKK